MAEERDDQLAVAVERRSAPDDGHDAVGAGEFEQFLDLVVGQPVCDVPQRALRREFFAQQLAPTFLVNRQRGRRQIIILQRVSQNITRKTAAQEAVINAAARRRLDEACRVADGEKPSAKGTLNRRQGQDFGARRQAAVEARAGSRAPARPDAGEEPVEMSTSIAFAHEADARKGSIATTYRHDPGKSFRSDVAEMQFDIARRRGRYLELRRLEKQRRHPQSEPAMKRVIGAAGQDARARLDALVTGDPYVHAAFGDLEVGDLRAHVNLRSGTFRSVAESVVEYAPIDDYGLDLLRRILDRAAGGTEELRGRQRIENGVSG